MAGGINIFAMPLYRRQRKNFRVTFPDGEYPDLCNDQIVTESVTMSEGISSENVFRFGTSESSTIEFDAVGIDDITGLKIACWIEVDVSSLEDWQISNMIAYPGDGVYCAKADSDLGYAYYGFPYGVYYVESCQTVQGYTGRRHVQASTIAPWTWSPVERARLDCWLGSSPKTVQNHSPKDLLFANLGYWWPDALTAAGYEQTQVGTFATLKSGATTYSFDYTSTSDGHTYTVNVSGKQLRTRGSGDTSDGLFSLEGDFGDATAAWEYFLSLYDDNNIPLPEIPQPVIPIDQRSPRTHLQPHVNNDTNNAYSPGSHSGMKGHFNPDFWITGDVNCALLLTDIPGLYYGKFMLMWDVSVTLSIDGTVTETQQFFPEADIDFTIYRWDDTDPFPYDVQIDASATLEATNYPGGPGNGTFYRCYSASYDLKDLLDGWLELHGQCMGFNRNGTARFWSTTGGFYGTALSKGAYRTFWWDETKPAYVSTILWSYTVDEEVQDMETTITDTPAEWIEDPGSAYDLRGNWILNNLHNVSAADTEQLIIDLLVPALEAEYVGWKCLSLMSCEITPVGCPWIEPGDLLIVDDSVRVFATHQSISGIQFLSHTVTSNGGLPHD